MSDLFETYSLHHNTINKETLAMVNNVMGIEFRWILSLLWLLPLKDTRIFVKEMIDIVDSYEYDYINYGIQWKMIHSCLPFKLTYLLCAFYIKIKYKLKSFLNR